MSIIKVPVGSVDLGDVAEETLRVDLGEDGVVLEIAQAVQEQLERKRNKTLSTDPANIPYLSHHTSRFVH